MIRELKRALRAAADAQDAEFLQRFFKTGVGEYAEGDKFLGVRVPATRKIVRQFPDASLGDALGLLQSEWHEERLLALLLMVRLYHRGDDETRRGIYDMYLANTRYINNWDLVDSSAEHVVGPYLQTRRVSEASGVLTQLAKSRSLWERRIAMLSTFHYIKQYDFALALHVAELLRDDGEDLIHKAVGWMLREIGERDRAALEQYLDVHTVHMPRTMLRYAIEKFPESKRQRYLKRK